MTRVHRSPEEETVTLGQYRSSLHTLVGTDVDDDGYGTAGCSCGRTFRIRPFKGRDVVEAAGEAWQTHARRERAGG